MFNHCVQWPIIPTVRILSTEMGLSFRSQLSSTSYREGFSDSLPPFCIFYQNNAYHNLLIIWNIIYWCRYFNFHKCIISSHRLPKRIHNFIGFSIPDWLSGIFVIQNLRESGEICWTLKQSTQKGSEREKRGWDRV